MQELENLLFDTGILLNDEGLTLLPNGVFIWNKIVSYLKNKFDKISYSEIYSSSLEDYVKEMSYLPCEHYSLSYSKNKIEFVSYGKYETEIEEARNVTIDVLEIYNKLGKDLLAIPFLSGKDPFNQDNNILITYQGEKNIESNYLGKYGSNYLSYSKISTDILYTLIEMHRDERGLVLPPKVSPYQIAIIPLKPNEKGVLKECKRLYEELLKNGYRVYLGNSTINKEKCITCGIPLIMEIGPRDLERNIIEVTCRDTLELKEFNNDHQFFDEVNWLLKKIQSRMYNKVLIKTTKSEKKVFNLGDLHNNKCEEVNKVMWCGDLNCLEQVKKHTNFISFNQQFHVGECLFCFKKAKHVISIIKKVKN